MWQFENEVVPYSQMFWLYFYDKLRDSANHKFGVLANVAKILLYMRGHAKNILNSPSKMFSNCLYVI